MPQTTVLFVSFAAVSVLVYWLVPARRRNSLLCLISSVFILMLDPLSFVVLFLLTALIFLGAAKPTNTKSTTLLAGLSLLFVSIRMLQLLHRTGALAHSPALLGFGFYILKLIHYRVERSSGNFREHGFADFYGYMFFFPTVTIGPIARFDEFLRSAGRIRWDASMFAKGIERILYGFVKVIVLANWLIAIQLLQKIEAFDPGPSRLSTLLDSVVYGFHLYFTFSGYSDIAIGLGLLFGYRLAENFNHPFLKRNIGEFWQSWHMTLSSWCRQYVFLPVFTRSRNLGVALVTAMVTLGLWHEFSVRYLLWGLYHGLGILVWRWFQKELRPRFPVLTNPIHRALGFAISVFLTFWFVILGFTIPRSESFGEIVRNFQYLIRG